MGSGRTLYEKLCDFNQGFGTNCSDLSNADKQDERWLSVAAETYRQALCDEY